MQRSAPPPAAAPATPAKPAAMGWFAGSMPVTHSPTKPVMQRSAPPPAAAPATSEGFFGLQMPEIVLPDFGDLVNVGESEMHHKLRKLESSRREAGAIDDDGAWLM